jgi:hypothetical protein
VKAKCGPPSGIGEIGADVDEQPAHVSSAGSRDAGGGPQNFTARRIDDDNLDGRGSNIDTGDDLVAGERSCGNNGTVKPIWRGLVA